MTDPTPSPLASPAVPPLGGPAVPLVRSHLSDGEWQRLHPLTPLLRGGLFLLVVAGIIVSNLRDRLLYIFLPGVMPDISADELEEWESSGDPIDWIIVNNLYLLALGVVLGVLLILFGVFYMSWRFHQFRITDDVVEVKSGVLFRTQRRAPLDRVQGVNLTRPMIARLLGASKLEVVGAGTDGNVKLEYLSTANAEEVRADILRLASGRRRAERGRATDASAAPGSRAAALADTVSRGITGLIEGDDLASPEPESVVKIPVGRLIASQIISPATVGLLFGIGAVIVGAINGIPWLLFSFIPAIIGFGAYWVRQTLKSLRYSIAPTPDGVRITFGLLTTITEIVPPGRVHAVEVSQSILWRGFGWWTIRINRLTGRSMSEGTADQFTTVLPVGTAADVKRVLRLLLTSVPEDEWPLLVRDGVLGGPQDGGFVVTPKRGWWVRPLSWRRNGFRLTDDVLLLRRGQIWRKLTILPLARLQSIAIQQGPLDRLARIASINGQTVMGPVLAHLAAVDRDAALGLFADVARGTVAASSGDRSHRWAAGVDAGGDASTGAGGDASTGSATGGGDASTSSATGGVRERVSVPELVEGSHGADDDASASSATEGGSATGGGAATGGTEEAGEGA